MPPPTHFLAALDAFAKRNDIQPRVDNLLRASISAVDVWGLVEGYRGSGLHKARDSNAIIMSDLRKRSIRSDIDSSIRLIDIFERSEGRLSRADQNRVENSTLVQVLMLIDDAKRRYGLDDPIEADLKERTHPIQCIEAFREVISDGSIRKVKNPSSYLSAHLKKMRLGGGTPSPRSRKPDSIDPATNPYLRRSRSRSPRQRIRDDSRRTEPRTRARDDSRPRESRRGIRDGSPGEESRRHSAPEPRSVPSVMSISRAELSIKEWTTRNGVPDRSAADLVNRFPFDAVLRGIASFPQSGPDGERLVLSLLSDPSCKGMPSIKTLGKEVDDYGTILEIGREATEFMRDQLFVRDADSIVAGQVPTLEKAVVATIESHRDRSRFVMDSLVALSGGKPMPPLPPTERLAAVELRPRVEALIPPGVGYLGGLMIGAPAPRAASYRTAEPIASEHYGHRR